MRQDERPIVESSDRMFEQSQICDAAYVIMIAGANEISSGAVGLTYLCAIIPSLLVKLTGPYW